MHAACQNFSTEEEVENVADIGFDCSLCRPYMPTSNGKRRSEWSVCAVVQHACARPGPASGLSAAPVFFL